MELRCLLGHDFGEPETEREREERGDEVVITVRQVRVCERCGERRVMSENKEVTALEELLDAADPNPDPESDAAGASESGAASASEPVDDASGAPASGGGRGGAGFADDGFDADAPSAAEDDGVILDDDGDDSGERRPGEWPDTDVSYPDQPNAGSASVADDARTAAPASTSASADGSESDAGGAAADDRGSHADGESGGDRGQAESGWPSVDADDEGFAAAQSETGGPTDVSFGGGLTPDPDANAGSGAGSDAPGTTGDAVSADDEDAEFIDADARAGDSDANQAPAPDADEGGSADGFARANPDSASVSGSGSPSGGRPAFHCPACGYQRPVGESSMRAGDICPNCHSGYIEERAD